VPERHAPQPATAVSMMNGTASAVGYSEPLGSKGPGRGTSPPSFRPRAFVFFGPLAHGHEYSSYARSSTCTLTAGTAVCIPRHSLSNVGGGGGRFVTPRL